MFLDWIEKYYLLNFFKYAILEGKDYHWLEFVEYKDYQTKIELTEYYEKVGFIICIIYLLNGCDFHFENLVSNGSYPILIDHETIIQP